MSSPPGFTGYIEFAEGFRPRSRLSHVLFDFDGTLSLIRQGWPEVMLPMFLECLPRRPDDSEEALRRLLHDDIMRLNGKQTIYQMIQFAERVQERGGQPREPLWYKNEYLRRLDERIRSRIEGLQSGALPPESLLVHNSLFLLDELRRRGFQLYLASGTDEPYVKKEAALLGIASFFGPHIYGAKDDFKSFSKKMIIERILAENSVPGECLLAFGDGYVEILNTKEAGGLAVAVASDEARNGSGIPDPWKRNRLKEVGADVVIADFRDAAHLMKVLTGGNDSSRPEFHSNLHAS